MAYRIMMKSKYDGQIDEVDDEIYQTKSEAKDALDEVITNFLEGADVLEMAGESFIDRDDMEFWIEKI